MAGKTIKTMVGLVLLQLSTLIFCWAFPSLFPASLAIGIIVFFIVFMRAYFRVLKPAMDESLKNPPSRPWNLS